MNKTPEDTEQVSTEPQRIALEAMSRELLQKLNMMVAEQEARSREFAAQQHSLSPTPIQPTPQATHRSQPVTPASHYRQHSPVVRPVAPPPPAHTTEPELPPPPPQYFPPIPSASKPTIIRNNKKEEEGIGATTIIIFIVVLIIILSKGCS